MIKKCVVCNREFNAKRDTAKFCGPSCRVKYSRQIDETPEIIADTETSITDDDWFNCAETKTQQEIEQHFTLANYPCNARYYGVTGSGYGSLSPYKATDIRHQAYLLR